MNAGETLRIGGFLFDTRSLTLTDPEGAPVALRPQSGHVLTHLARHAGEIVDKTDLITAVWGNFNVTDDSLVQCIREIRHAIGDADRRLVRTFPKRGYMLVGADAPEVVPETPAGRVALLVEGQGADAVALAALVRESLDGVDGSGVALAPGLHLLRMGRVDQALAVALRLRAGGSARGIRLRALLDRVAGAETDGALGQRLAPLLATAAPGEILASEDLREQAIEPLDCSFADRGEAGPADRRIHVFAVLPAAPQIAAQIAPEDLLPTIAVFPLRADRATMDGAAGDIFADDLIMSLSRAQDFNVISRLSTDPFRDRQTPLPLIKASIRADFVVSGSIRTGAGGAVLNIELTELSGDSVIWADRLEAPLAQIVNEPEIVQRVLGPIRKAVMMHGVVDVQKHSLDDARTHSLLLSAVHLMHRLTLREFMMAQDLLSTLIRRYPRHAAPLAWMARWHVLRLQQGWTDDAPGAARAALDCAHRALELNPENTLALISEGHVLTNLWHRLDEAQERYDAALDINPNDANGLILRGMLHGYRGRGPEAKRDAERALHLAPLDPHRFFFLALAAGACLVDGDHARALELSRHSLRLNRSHTSTLRGKIVAHVGLDEMQEARETARLLMDLQPNFRVGDWLKTSPAAGFDIGQKIAASLRQAGVPS